MKRVLTWTWKNFLEEWVKSIPNIHVENHPSWCFLIIEDISAIKIPFQENLSLRDNFFLLSLFLVAHHTYTFKAVTQSRYEGAPLLEPIDKLICPAIWTGIRYHEFIFQTATENLSMDSKDLDSDFFQDRLQSWYTTITELSSHLEMCALIFLDELATKANINPFMLMKKRILYHSILKF